MTRISLASAAIPFRHAFAHASAKRTQAANVLVRLESGGLTGLGEGCAREYVTGETQDGALAWLREQAPKIVSRVTDLATLRTWLAANRETVDRHPSAFCALELALLDLFARRAGVSVETLLALPEASGPLQVNAVYGAASNAAFHLQRLRFGLAGMGEAKLKLTGEGARDLHRARRLAGRGALRLDANNLFPGSAEAIAGLAPLEGLAWAVEEPVAARDWAGMAAVAAASGLAIILDESVLTPRDLHAAPAGPEWIANLRVSKLGGLLRAIETIKTARTLGMGVILGAQVGETSLLARAGLAAAAAAGPLKGCEIGYGTHLLAHDLVSPQTIFDHRGRLALPDRAAPGWGLKPLARLDAAFEGLGA